MRKIFLVSAVTVLASLAAYAEDSDKAATGQNQANSGNARDEDRQNATGRNTKGADERSGSQSRGEGQWKNSDHCAATCVAYGNQVEIAMSKIASQKSKDKDVKKFAEMMLQDHEQYLQKLAKYSPEATRKDALSDASDGSRSGGRESARNSSQPSTQQGRDADDKTSGQGRTADNRAGGGDDQHAVKSAQMEREMAEQCLMSGRKKLDSKSGDAFDRCYMHGQIAAHEQMKDKLTVLQRHASGDLASILADGLKTTEHHLAKAEEIVKSLESQSGSGKSDNR